MAFTDIKCLESLLIEGEELIATEGFIDTIKNMAKQFVAQIGKIFRLIAGLFKKLAAKFHSKKGQNPPEKNDASQSKEVSEEPQSKEKYKVKDNIFRATIVEDFIHSIDNAGTIISRLNNRCISYCIEADPENIASEYEKAKEYIQDGIDKIENLFDEIKTKRERVKELLNKCNNEMYYTVAETCAKYCDNASSHCSDIADTFDNYVQQMDEISNADNVRNKYGYVKENTSKSKAIYRLVQQNCSMLNSFAIKLQKEVSEVSKALNSATIIYD